MHSLLVTCSLFPTSWVPGFLLCGMDTAWACSEDSWWPLRAQDRDGLATVLSKVWSSRRETWAGWILCVHRLWLRAWSSLFLGIDCLCEAVVPHHQRNSDMSLRIPVLSTRRELGPDVPWESSWKSSDPLNWFGRVCNEHWIKWYSNEVTLDLASNLLWWQKCWYYWNLLSEMCIE